jgi:hypothetical protein
MQIMKRLALATAIGVTTLTAQAAHHENAMDAKAVASGWVDAACGDLDGFIQYVKAHMADDGHWMPNRYVGLGFTMDADRDTPPTVSLITPDSPASKVLQEGDVFVSVNGVAATWENRDKMSFRGKPGEPVPAVIRRDGKEMQVEVSRGIIAPKNSKARALEGLALADADEWPTDSCKVLEVVQEGSVVYVFSEWTDTESDTGIEYSQRAVNRFRFNDAGKVVEGWGMNEDRFGLEQLGYTISR